MSIDDSALDAVALMRSQLDQIHDDHVRETAKAWAAAWDDVAGDLDAALSELADQAGDGRITRKAVIRSERLRKALDAIRVSLDELFEQSGQSAVERLGDIVDQAGTMQESLIANQLPDSERAIVNGWSRVDQRQIAAIVTRTTEQITKLSYPLSDEATAVMRRELFRGLAGGKNPRDVAAKMLKRTEGTFNGGLSRALTIARTETLDAHRAAAGVADAANADILEGWIWTASLSARTCSACWGMHGTLFPLTQAGPEGHQNCRCARVPKTKPWADLGFDIEEPPSLMPDASTVFDGLPETTQREILGPRRLDAWKTGDYPIDSWATKRTNDDWRDSWVPTKAPVAA